MHFVIVLAVTLLEQKYYTHQCRQFVTAAAICADKTTITLNILNSNEHTHAAQPTREETLRVIRGYQHKLQQP